MIKKGIATIRILLGLLLLIVNIMIGLDIFTKVGLNIYGIIATTIGSILFLCTSAYLIYSGITSILNKHQKQILIKIGLSCYFLFVIGFVLTWFFNMMRVGELWVFHLVFLGMFIGLGVEELKMMNRNG